MFASSVSRLALRNRSTAASFKNDSSTPPKDPVTSTKITAQDLSERIKVYSDNYYDGRGASPRGQEAAQRIADDMKKIGLKPGNKGSYFQDVPAVTIKLDPAKSSFKIGDTSLKFSDDVVFFSSQYGDKTDKTKVVDVKDAPLVYVGYGINAPEEGWNDYDGVDVKGKIVVIKNFEPGHFDKDHDPKLFKGKTLTYYGRWTYKLEEAARQGAVGVIIIPPKEQWGGVRNAFAGARGWLENDSKNKNRAAIEGWMSPDAAAKLFTRPGLDFEQLHASADKKGFKAVDLGQTVNATAVSNTEFYNSKNIIGVIPGKKRPDEVVMFTGHWDHLGNNPNAKGDDKIFNGAVDNAIGIAGHMEIAQAMIGNPKKRNTAPDRTVAFVAVGLEEQGLLGSDYNANNLLWPAGKIAGGINIDMIIPKPKTKDFIVYGSGSSEMENLLAAELKPQGRTIAADPDPDQGIPFRSDQASYIKKGIPFLFGDGGNDLVVGGVEAGKTVRADFMKNKYHQANDEWDPKWVENGMMDGPVQDLEAFMATAKKLANSNLWPNWFEGNQFKTIRDASRKPANKTIY